MAEVYFVLAMPVLALKFRGGQLTSCVFSHFLDLDTDVIFSIIVSHVSRPYLWWLTPRGDDAANSTEHCWLHSSTKFTS